jgi:hypothetical protein
MGQERTSGVADKKEEQFMKKWKVPSDPWAVEEDRCWLWGKNWRVTG